MINTDTLFDFDSEDTHDIPLPVSDVQRYISQYDAAALDVCTLSKWEHNSPGALGALRLWAGSRCLPVVVRDCRSNAGCVAYEVAVEQSCITVYVKELT